MDQSSSCEDNSRLGGHDILPSTDLENPLPSSQEPVPAHYAETAECSPQCQTAFLEVHSTLLCLDLSNGLFLSRLPTTSQEFLDQHDNVSQGLCSVKLVQSEM
jgi:hypothetical protein